MKYYTVVLKGKGIGTLELLTSAADEDEASRRAWRWIRFHKFRMWVVQVLLPPLVTSTQARLDEKSCKTSFKT